MYLVCIEDFQEGLKICQNNSSSPVQASNEELVHSRSTGALTDDPMMSWRVREPWGQKGADFFRNVT